MTDDRGHRAKRALLRVAYWLAAIAIALVLVAALALAVMSVGYAGRFGGGRR